MQTEIPKKKPHPAPPCRDISDVDAAVRSYVDFPVFSPHQRESSPHQQRDRNTHPSSPRRSKTNPKHVSTAPNLKTKLSGSNSKHSNAKKRLETPATVSLGCRLPPFPSHHDQVQEFSMPDRRSKRFSLPFTLVSRPSVSSIDEEAQLFHHHTETSLHRTKEEVSSPPVPFFDRNRREKQSLLHQHQRSNERSNLHKASASEVYNSSKFAYGSPPSYGRALYNDFAYGSPPSCIGGHLRQKSREENVANQFHSSPIYNDDNLRDNAGKKVMENSFYNDGDMENQTRKEHETSFFNDTHLRKRTGKEDVETPLYNSGSLGIQTRIGKMQNPIYNGGHLSDQTRKASRQISIYNGGLLRNRSRKEDSEDGYGNKEYVKDECSSSVPYNRGHQRGDVEDLHRSTTSLKQKESPISLDLAVSEHNRSVLDIQDMAKQVDFKESRFHRNSLKIQDNKSSRRIQDAHNLEKQMDHKESHIRRVITNDLSGSIQNLMQNLKQIDIKESHNHRDSLRFAANEHSRSVQDVHNIARHMDLKESQIRRASLGPTTSEQNRSGQNVHNVSTDVKPINLKESHFWRANELSGSVQDSQNFFSDLKQTDIKKSHFCIKSLRSAVNEVNKSGNIEQENRHTEFVETQRGSSTYNELSRSGIFEHVDEPTVFAEFGCRKNRNPIFPWERRPQEYSSRKTRSIPSVSPNIELPSVGAIIAEEYMHHETPVFGTYTEKHDKRDVGLGASVSTTYSSELLNVSSDHGSFGSTDTSELSAILQSYCDNHNEDRGRSEEERLMEQELNWPSSGLRESGERRYFSAESQLFDWGKKPKDKKGRKAKCSRGKTSVSGLEKSLSAQDGKEVKQIDSESLFHETIRTARGFLSLLAVSVMEVSNNECNELLRVAGQPSPIFAHRHHIKYGAQALINKLIFQEFDESSYSGMNRIVERSVLLNEFQSMSMASSIDAIGPSNESYDAWFHRFCNWKLLLLEKNMPWLISWRDYLAETFLEAMKYVWKSHLLAQSSHGVITLYEVKQWTRYHGVIMEVVNPDYDDALYLPEVQLLVNPGFHLQYTTIKAQVYLLPRAPSFDSHVGIKHKDWHEELDRA